jgi:NAD(P)-dependent dehydrogenase (short-subunit alcohol dehydrogenase family)
MFAGSVLPSLRVDGQRALVTGASGGIGGGCALALAEAGADLILAARSLRRLDAVVQEVEARSRRAEAVACDVTDAKAVARTMASVGPLDVVVNAAGANIPEPFVDVSQEHLDAFVGLNLKGTFLVAQTATRQMLEAGRRGAIVNISSQMGHVGDANRTVYCATKHAVEGLTRAMAIELAPHGIRVNAVAPTFVETPMTARFFADANFRESVERRIPLGRIGDIEDVVGAVVYLASPAAALVTGASLLVDGGWTAR